MFYNVKMRCWVARACFFICVNLIAGDPHWTRLVSPNFEMYTTAGARSARDTLRYFQQVHSFFDQQMPKAAGPAERVRIVAFSSMKEYAPYRPNEVADAHYQQSGEHDYIVMSHTGSETFPVAIHEYVHLIVRHAGMNFPPWLNEGVAELYSTLTPHGKDILVGSLIAGRFQALFQDKWIPLAAILDAGHDSPYYNEKNKAGSLYNEGWALTHMLALSPEYRAKFPQVMTLISDGTRSDDALAQIYGKSLNMIETELRAYLRGGKFQGALFPLKLEKVEQELNPEPADEFELKLMLAEIGDRPTEEDATRKTFESLILLHPDRVEPYVDLAYLDWRQNHRDAAREHFRKAFELGSRTPRMLWDYGRMEESGDSAKAAQALQELMKLQPDRLDVRMELASVQLRAHAAKDALETLAPVKTVTPKDAPRLLTLIAYANLDAGNRDKAENAATQLKKVATTPEERDQADRILDYLARSRPGAVQARVLTQTTDAPPVVARRDTMPDPPGAPTLRTRPTVKLPSAAGTFVEFQCGDELKIVMQTLEGKKRFLIQDPDKLLVNGDSGQTRDLNCGPQKPVRIRVEYDPPGPDQPGIDGLLRVIHFQ